VHTEVVPHHWQITHLDSTCRTVCLPCNIQYLDLISNNECRVLSWLTLSSSRHASKIGDSSSITGMSVMFTNQLGPCLHSTFLFKSKGVVPHDGISTGFSLPGQWRQYLVGTNFHISLTWFWMNGFHSLFSPLIQYNATVKQAIELNTTSCSSATSTLCINLARRSADSSSNLGMVCVFTGQTIVLAVTNSNEFPTIASTLTYTTAA